MHVRSLGGRDNKPIATHMLVRADAAVGESQEENHINYGRLSMRRTGLFNRVDREVGG